MNSRCGSLLLTVAVLRSTTSLRVSTNSVDIPEQEYKLSLPQLCEEDTACYQEDDLAEEMDELDYTIDTMNDKVSEPDSKPKRGKPMIWVHVHKSAGTTMCHLAFLNREKVPPNCNCNWKGHDGWHQLGLGAHTSCENRTRLFQEHKWTWTQIEREIQPDDFCEGFAYGVNLRDPVKLAVSWINHEMQKGHIENASSVATWHQQGNDCKETVELVECPGQPIGKLPSWLILDNFMVRFLLGTEGMQIPPGQVTEDHADRVIKILSKFEVVGIVEELYQRSHRELFQDELGWKVPIKGRRASRANHRAHSITQFPESFLAYVRETTKMDAKVYEHFKNLPLKQRGAGMRAPVPAHN